MGALWTQLCLALASAPFIIQLPFFSYRHGHPCAGAVWGLAAGVGWGNRPGLLGKGIWHTVWPAPTAPHPARASHMLLSKNKHHWGLVLFWLTLSRSHLGFFFFIILPCRCLICGPLVFLYVFVYDTSLKAYPFLCGGFTVVFAGLHA